MLWESKAIGQYEEESEGSLLGLAIGMILEIFHIWGIVFVVIVMLKGLVKCLMSIGPRCLSCLMFMLSGSVELLFLDCFIA